MLIEIRLRKKANYTCPTVTTTVTTTVTVTVTTTTTTVTTSNKNLNFLLTSCTALVIKYLPFDRESICNRKMR